MKIASVIRALEKAGYKVNTVEEKNYDSESGSYKVYRKSWWAESLTHICGWYSSYEGDEVVCVHVERIGQEIDMRSDHLPGYYPDTIKRLIQAMTR